MSEAMKPVQAHIARCDGKAAQPQIVSNKGDVTVTVDRRSTVKFERRSSATVDLWKVRRHN